MKPNIIMIVSDQHRFCDVGYCGNEDVSTPNMDYMAREGVWFSNAYSSCPLCVPARGSLFTGLHALHHGAAANDMPVRKGLEGIADVMVRAGYDTAHVGKWHIGGIPREKFITKEERLGFQYWRGYECNHSYQDFYYDDDDNVRHKEKGYEPETQTSLALEYIEHHEKESDKPYFLSLCFAAPHDPYRDIPEEYLKKYDDMDLKMRPNFEEKNREMTGMLAGDIVKSLAGYYAHIEQIDRQIGRILSYLEETGQAEHTLVLYTSDHGDMLKSHGLGMKQYPFEESAKIPMVFYYKGHLAKGKRSQPVGLVDLPVTIAAIAGGKFTSDVDGIDFSKALYDPDAFVQDAVYFYSYVPCHAAQLQKIGSWRAISTGDYMIGADQKGKIRWMYDLTKDPYQMHNLKDEKEYRKLRDQLKEMLDGYVQKYDGYKPWIFLLADHGLQEDWFASERHFSGAWGGKMRTRAVEKTEKRQRKKIAKYLN